MIAVNPGDQEPNTRTLEMTIPMTPAHLTIPDPIPDPDQDRDPGEALDQDHLGIWDVGLAEGED